MYVHTRVHTCTLAHTCLCGWTVRIRIYKTLRVRQVLPKNWAEWGKIPLKVLREVREGLRGSDI